MKLSLSVVAATLLLASAFVSAHAAPIFHYSFPASWNGAGSVVTDLSGAGNHGVTNGGTALSATIPAGAPNGTMSLLVNSGTTAATRGGIGTTGTSLLNNPAIAASGGFRYDITFMWDGTVHTTWSGYQKVLDYAGTESLQLQNANATSGTADLFFIFTQQNPSGSGDVATGPSLPILANTWYTATGLFDTGGGTIAGDGSITGVATLTVTPVGGSSSSAFVPVFKTTYGDGLNRAISVGAWAGNSDSVYFHGLIYDAAVTLVPEPSLTGLLALAGLALLRRR